MAIDVYPSQYPTQYTSDYQDAYLEPYPVDGVDPNDPQQG